MSLIKTEDAVLINVASNFTGTLTKDHVALYLAGPNSDDVKWGEIVSVAGKTPAEAFTETYSHLQRGLTKDGNHWNAYAFFIIDRDPKKKKWYDNDSREFFAKKKKQGKIAFNAIYIKTRDGMNNAEALPGFKFDRDFDTLTLLVKSWLGIDPTFNTKEDWTARPQQPTAIAEAVQILASPSTQCLFAAYTAFGKAHSSLKIAHDHLPKGGLALVTTPVVDTLQSFEDGLDQYRYGNPNQKVSFYNRNTILDQDPKDLKRRVKAGELIFVFLSVQGLRRDNELFDRDGIDTTEETKYYRYVKDIDLWIADEYHREYGGKETSKFFATVNARKLLRVTATPMAVLDQFDWSEIVARTLVWGLQNRKLTDLPYVSIQALGEKFYELRPEMRDLYSTAEGYDARKQFEIVDGQFPHRAAHEELTRRQYFLPLGKKKNPLQIHADPALSNSQVGMVIIPEGSNGSTATDVANLYCANHNETFANRGTLWISAYQLDSDRKSLSVSEYVEVLLKDYERVIIVTHRKFTTGTDIPQLGHLVLLDKISSIVEFEQILGRIIRIHKGKTKVVLYALCPGATLKANLVHMAQTNNKYYKGTDPKQFLECIPLSEYEGGTLIDRDPEQMLEEYWDTQRGGLKLRLPIQPIDAFFRSNNGLAELWSQLGNQLKAGSGFSFGLADANGAGVVNSKKKGKKKPNIKRLNGIKDYIETLKAMWNEVPSWAVLMKERSVSKVFGCKPMRQMFSDQFVDTVLESFKLEPKMRKRLQEELDRYTDSCASLSHSDLYNYVFKNSEYKMKMGLVYLPLAIAQAQVNSVKYNTDIVFVVNALNGTYVLAAQERWPGATIVCLETWPYYADHLRSLGAIVATNEQELNTIIKGLNVKKRPVLLTNPPYTDGTSAANDIYTPILTHCIDSMNPIAICGVTPENLINGGQKKKTLREKISKQYGWKSVKFLNQVRDWKGDIAIDTISWVVEEGYAGPTTVTGRVLNEDYTVDMTKFSELVNGETQDLHDWMTGIQTAKKLVLNNPAGKDTGNTGLQLKISKDVVDSCAVEQGKEFDSHNAEWRVAFGYLRCNTCAVVPPGPSISGKYRYLNFGVNGEVQARRFAQYMLSEPVRLIILLTYNSRSLDNPQLSYVPMINLSQFTNISNDVLYQHWNTSTDTQQIIVSLVGGKVPF
jgi:superfamily II DNA or RNA helicase